MKVIEYNTYGFRLDIKDDKPIIVVAPTMIEAMQVFRAMYVDEPHDVMRLGTSYLADSEI